MVVKYKREFYVRKYKNFENWEFKNMYEKFLKLYGLKF